LVRYASFPDPLGGATERGITTAADWIQLYYHYGDKRGGTIDVDLVSGAWDQLVGAGGFRHRRPAQKSATGPEC
jgi:hypothetical protein